MNKKQLKEDKQSKEKFLKDLAQEGWDSGHPFDSDDFIEFKQICKESGYNVTKADFDRYFEIFDDIRYDYYHQDEEEDEDEGMIYAVVNFKDDTSDEKYFKKIPEAINWCKKTYTQEGAESAQVYDDDYGKLVWKWSEKDDIVFDESLKESVKIADIEVKDEDYIFDEDTGNIHLTDEVVNYHPKYKNYINVKFVDDEDEKIYTYKLVEYNPKETNYPYEFEYVSEAEDFVDMEESLTESDKSNYVIKAYDDDYDEDEYDEPTYSYEEAVEYIEDQGVSCAATDDVGYYVCDLLDEEEDDYDLYLESTLDSIIERAKDYEAELEKEDGEEDDEDYDEEDKEEEVPFINGLYIKENKLIKADESIKTANIPNNVTSIGEDAFEGRISLTRVTIPDGVTSIERHAFYGCDSLSSITIPDSVTSIGSEVFGDCDSLSSITYQGTKKQWNEIHKDRAWDYEAGAYTIHCTDGDIRKQTNESLNKKSLKEARGKKPKNHLRTEFKLSKNGKVVQGAAGNKHNVEIPQGVEYVDTNDLKHTTGSEITLPKSLKAMFRIANPELTDIYYEGTKEDWGNIKGIRNNKRSYWNFFLHDYVVHCTDGDIKVDLDSYEESLKENKDDADMLVDIIDTELRYYGFYDPYYIKECKGDIEIMWDDYCNDNENVNKEDTEIKIIFKELMQPHISNIQK